MFKNSGLKPFHSKYFFYGNFRLEELADVFGGKQKLSRIEPNKKLQKWLLLRGIYKYFV